MKSARMEDSEKERNINQAERLEKEREKEYKGRKSKS